MPTVVVPANVKPCQVDEFPADCERSVKGALHIRPISTVELTAGELAHIEKTKPELFKRLIVANPVKSIALERAHSAAVAKEAAEAEAKKKAEEVAAGDPQPQPKPEAAPANEEAKPAAKKKSGETK